MRLSARSLQRRRALETRSNADAGPVVATAGRFASALRPHAKRIRALYAGSPDEAVLEAWELARSVGVRVMPNAPLSAGARLTLTAMLLGHALTGRESVSEELLTARFSWCLERLCALGAIDEATVASLALGEA